jgi:hypothetical protein
MVIVFYHITIHYETAPEQYADYDDHSEEDEIAVTHGQRKHLDLLSVRRSSSLPSG